MGCGASAQDKYKEEHAKVDAIRDQPAVGSGQTGQDKPAATLKEEAPAVVAPSAAPAAEKPAEARGQGLEGCGQETTVLPGATVINEAAAAEGEVSPTVEPRPPSEPEQSLAAEAVVAEAEAALAEATVPAEEAAAPEPAEAAPAGEAAEAEFEDGEDDDDLSDDLSGASSCVGMVSASAALELERPAGARLGISVRSIDSCVLLITEVQTEGLIHAWNVENSDRAVNETSRIIQVNGISGIADQMLDELREAVKLKIEVDRTHREIKAQLSSAGMAAFCREQIHAMYTRHDEAGLKTLDRRLQTYKDRELALYRTLSKKFGEEPKDPELCPNSLEDVLL